MKKPKFYKHFLKRKKKKVNVVISVLDRREYVRFAPKVGVYKKRKKLYSILKTFVVMEFLQTTQWELGEKIQIRNRNLDVIHNSLKGLRILVRSRTKKYVNEMEKTMVEYVKI